MTTQSTITYSKGGTMFCGADAVDLFRLAALRSALGLLSKGIQPARGFTVTYGLRLAADYTGQTYKRSQIEKARMDLETLLKARKAAIDTIRE